MKGAAAVLAAALCFGASPACAAPRLDKAAVKDKGSEVEIAVSIHRSRFDTGSCDARVDFGDGQGRNVEFGVASTRTVRHVYKRGGSYTVTVRGAGGSPCDGALKAALTVAGEAKKKAEPKKKSAKKDDRKGPTK